MDSQLDKELQSAFDWESLDTQPIDDGNMDKALELAKEIHKAFNSGSGKYVLKHLINTYLTKPIVRPGDDAFACGIREGRADVIRQILHNIEFAKKGDR